MYGREETQFWQMGFLKGHPGGTHAAQQVCSCYIAESTTYVWCGVQQPVLRIRVHVLLVKSACLSSHTILSNCDSQCETAEFVSQLVELVVYKHLVTTN